MSDRLRQMMVIFTVLATLAVNTLANILPFNGQTTGEVSRQIDTYFTPAAYVFSIWGLIYLCLSLFTIYQALPANRKNPRLRAAGWWVSLSGVANMAWLFLWHYERFPLTLVAMLFLLVSLVMVYLKLEIQRQEVSIAEKWLAHLTFSIYLGWVSVATIANISVLLVSLQWDGWGISPVTWTTLVLTLVLLLGIAVSLTRRDIAFNAVLLWALAGIGVRNTAFPAVAIPAWSAFVLVALALAAALLIQGKKQRNKKTELND